MPSAERIVGEAQSSRNCPDLISYIITRYQIALRRSPMLELGARAVFDSADIMVGKILTPEIKA